MFKWQMKLYEWNGNLIHKKILFISIILGKGKNFLFSIFHATTLTVEDVSVKTVCWQTLDNILKLLRNKFAFKCN